MALHLIRTTQEAEFVHRSDSAAVDGKGPLDGWLAADGQALGCTRFRVRPLSSAEVAEAVALEDGQAQRVCAMGWRALDGQPPPTDLAAGWHGRVADLIWAVTLHGPFGERRSP